MTDKLIERLSEAQALYEASGLHGENGAKIMKDAKARILANAEALKAADELAVRVKKSQDGWPHRPGWVEEALATYNAKRGE